FLDLQPADNTVSRGDTLIVSGYVRNDGGFIPNSVSVEVLRNGNPTSFTAATDSNGEFTIPVYIDLSTSPGSYIISIQVISTYHEMRFGPVAWNIDVFIASEVGVTVTSESLLPGESFTIDLQLIDDDDNPLVGEEVTLYLGTIFVRNVQMTSDRMTVVIQVPLTWTDSGLYTITADYPGSLALFIDPDSFESLDSIHVFTDVNFQRITPNRIDPGQSFAIEVALLDPNDNPILNRNIRLNINGTDYPMSSGSDGLISYQMGSYPEGTSFSFTLTVLSSEVTPVTSERFTVNIQTAGGNPLQGTDLLIAGILLVGAVVAVLAYLYIVRGMFRSPVISRGIDIPTKLRNIKKLADSGKYGASITLAYRTFEQMCGTKMNSERSHNETAREYLDRVLQAIPLDLTTVEQFVQTYEEARFSHHEMTREKYEEAVRIFTDLYPRIDSAAPVE
ncbi:MAG: DUF4129 domain-containing protein, partial [Candidatus Thorarchaeota archaeon]